MRPACFRPAAGGFGGTPQATAPTVADATAPDTGPLRRQRCPRSHPQPAASPARRRPARAPPGTPSRESASRTRQPGPSSPAGCARSLPPSVFGCGCRRGPTAAPPLRAEPLPPPSLRQGHRALPWCAGLNRSGHREGTVPISTTGGQDGEARPQRARRGSGVPWRSATRCVRSVPRRPDAAAGASRRPARTGGIRSSGSGSPGPCVSPPTALGSRPVAAAVADPTPDGAACSRQGRMPNDPGRGCPRKPSRPPRRGMCIDPVLLAPGGAPSSAIGPRRSCMPHRPERAWRRRARRACRPTGSTAAHAPQPCPRHSGRGTAGGGHQRSDGRTGCRRIAALPNTSGWPGTAQAGCWRRGAGVRPRPFRGPRRPVPREQARTGRLRPGNGSCNRLRAGAPGRAAIGPGAHCDGSGLMGEGGQWRGLDGTAIPTRLDRRASNIAVPAAGGARRDGRKVLPCLSSPADSKTLRCIGFRPTGGARTAAWRRFLDDLDARPAAARGQDPRRRPGAGGVRRNAEDQKAVRAGFSRRSARRAGATAWRPGAAGVTSIATSRPVVRSAWRRSPRLAAT